MTDIDPNSPLKVLALDVSSHPCCAIATVLPGVTTEAAINGFSILGDPRDLSKDLIQLWQRALEDAGQQLEDVQLLAVGLGPGSWTGLRIGISAMKTLAQARELPLCGVGTFDAMRESIAQSASGPAAFIAPSRPGEVYGCVTIVEGEDALDIRLWSPRELARRLAECGQSPLVVGKATPADTAAVNEVVTELKLGIESRQRVVNDRELISGLAQVAARRFRHGQSDDLFRVAPLYLAPSNAERVREAKLRAAAQPA